ncbi:uncharacterized protein LOC135613969 [Musa acuminata AAA Group]|uniref:uncharacterized protein LOC135613969 n=1 Tax=Musa acuminata AAA Group TaxID=214697 RepID=UPI0031D4F706
MAAGHRWHRQRRSMATAHRRRPCVGRPCIGGGQARARTAAAVARGQRQPPRGGNNRALATAAASRARRPQAGKAAAVAREQSSDSMITDFMLTLLAHIPIDEEPSWDVEGVGEDGDFGGIPASTDAVKELAVVKYERGGDVREESCIICFEEFDEGVEVTRMPCKHAFHGGCLTRWLESSHVCPLCRHAIPASADP